MLPRGPNPSAVPPAGRRFEISPALVQSAQLISNSNLRASAHDTGPVAPEQPVEVLFNLARQQHSQKNYDQAQKNFTAVLNAEAAPPMKRSALIELAVMAQEQNQLARAEQILAHYAARYPEDPSVPEVLLRQGLLAPHAPVATSW